MSRARERPSLIQRMLRIIEVGGNLLPNPATLFALLAVAVVVLSAVATYFDLSVLHPGTGKTVAVVNLLSIEGLHRILTSLVTNFTSFAPLGTVLVAMLGMAVAEGSGLMGAALKLLVHSSPRRLLTFTIVLAGVLSNMASEIGYVLLVPLAATVFLSAGRHPVAGLAAAFAGVSGGYSANLFLGTIDPLLAGISQEAARLVDPTYAVNPACNYFFMAASTFLITIAGTWVTERIVVPRLGEYTGTETAEAGGALQPAEWRGLAASALVALAFVGVLMWGTIPADGFLRDPKTGSLLHSPFMSGIVALIFFGGVLCGLAYGLVARTVRSDEDVVRAMGKSMSVLGTYLVLVFFAAQFVAYFNWTNLGLIVAVTGADGLRAMGLDGPVLFIGFILLTAVINLFMGSASAKWAIMAPVFVPLFMLLGYSPELTQTAYRIGDSSANVISPLMSYFPLVVAFLQRYDPRAGIGTLAATMIPYTVVFLVIWTALLMIWFFLDLPVGPGSPMRWSPPAP